MSIDPIRQIQAFNAGRDPQRLAMKYRAMQGDPFVFLRGTCHLFYDRLPRGGVFKSAPLVWSCGDLHLENFGSYKADNGLVYFDVNDFDEAALAPASWDLVRLLTSLQVGAETLSIGGSKARALCRKFLDAYAYALGQGKAYWAERDTAIGLVRELLNEARKRERSAFLDARTVHRGNERRLRIDAKKLLKATKPQRNQVIGLMREFAQGQPDPKAYEVLDVACRVAGTGSLGLERFAILVRGQGSPDGNELLDLKQMLPSALAPHLKARQPRWKTQARRVAALQSRFQAVPAALLHPVMLGDMPCLLRALQPSDDKIALKKAGDSYPALEELVVVLADIVAWGHLRGAGRDGSAIADELIDFARRKKWKQQLLLATPECAAQVHQDSAAFDAACADNAFGVPVKG